MITVSKNLFKPLNAYDGIDTQAGKVKPIEDVRQIGELNEGVIMQVIEILTRIQYPKLTDIIVKQIRVQQQEETKTELYHNKTA